MNEFQTLASLVFFKNLYNSKKDIFSAISLMIENIIIRENLISFEIQEMLNYIEKYYGFNIIEQIVNTSLKKLDYLDKKSSKFYINKQKIKLDCNDLQNKYHSLNQMVDNIYKELIGYIKKTTSIDKKDEYDIQKEFVKFLYSNYTTGKYSKYIYSFLIVTSSINDINDIKKGIILHQALQYSPNSDSISNKITEDLNIYCDTEILFSLKGYNGDIHQKYVKNFFDIVNEVNNKKKNKIIKLYYFSTTKDKIDNFFDIAEKILNGEISLIQNVIAMESIIKNAKQASDIVSKKIDFFNTLKEYGIAEKEIKPYDEIKKEYNLSDKNLYMMLETKNKTDNYEYISEIINNINSERIGKNINDFKKMKSVFLSANKTYLNASISMVNKDCIPHVLNVDFLTTQLWLRLNKGFEQCPTTFDAAINAQIALSALLNTNIQKELESESNNKNKTKEERIQEIAIFRSNILKPENITKEILEANKEFINETSIEVKKMQINKMEKENENLKKEIEYLKNKANKDGTIIDQYKLQEWLKKKKILKLFKLCSFCIVAPLYIATYIACAYILYEKFFKKTFSEIIDNLEDSLFWFSVVSFLFYKTLPAHFIKKQKIIFKFIKKIYKYIIFRH
ncbi:hypothetical protein UPTC5044_0334 [Campylobacter lari]|uniref:hypothetical protein n=1 Tax=Campylobacter lari TaxID=201 RepID=UPI0021531F51|nr:hypothetical protein [Campylobacter lari]MCR6512589.1 hypothetical protein [Campylobacter lari]